MSGGGTMRGMIAAGAVGLLMAAATPACNGQQTNETSVRGQDQFSTDFAGGGHVRLYLCSSSVEISGTNEEKIQVHFKAQHSEDISHMRVSFKKKGDTG